MTLAAVDRLVHHATIFEINVDSYRRRARPRTQTRRREATSSTRQSTNTQSVSLRDNQIQNSPCQRQSNPTEHQYAVATTVSHPDCRAPLIQIVALHRVQQWVSSSSRFSGLAFNFYSSADGIVLVLVDPTSRRQKSNSFITNGKNVSVRKFEPADNRRFGIFGAF